MVIVISCVTPGFVLALIYNSYSSLDPRAEAADRYIGTIGVHSPRLHPYHFTLNMPTELLEYPTVSVKLL
jgi:saccharopine dehydrogenase-like NADP-dependent oxidoreductase